MKFAVERYKIPLSLAIDKDSHVYEYDYATLHGSLGTRDNSTGPKERTTGTWKTNNEMGGRHEATSRKPMD
jgi:hypothetical protein